MRNPHGVYSEEWTGPWSDGDDQNWSTIPQEDELNLRLHDGTFWMEASDMFRIYELVSFCLLPSSWDPALHQIDIFGRFIDGVNAPHDGDLESEALSRNKNFQFLINVDASDVELWIQLLLEISNLLLYENRIVSINLYSGLTQINGKPYSHGAINRFSLVKPLLPHIDTTKPSLFNSARINQQEYG